MIENLSSGKKSVKRENGFLSSSADEICMEASNAVDRDFCGNKIIEILILSVEIFKIFYVYHGIKSLKHVRQPALTIQLIQLLSRIYLLLVRV